MKTRSYVAVIFPKCGAEFHPAFEQARPIAGDHYRLDFPIHIESYQKSKRAQQLWAEEKVKHIRSWGATAEIIQI